MSKDFEKEYKEYLNAQAPDLWDRIEAGVDASEQKVPVMEEADAKVIPISGKKSKKARKKRKIRYQHYRMIVSVAACLFALVIAVPVFLFTRPESKAEMAADSAPQMVENVTIQNLVVDSAESEVAMEDSAPMEEAADGTTEIEIAEETLTEESMMAAETTEQKGTGTDGAETTAVTDGGENVGQIAEPENPHKDDTISDMLQEESSGQQEEMTVTILSEAVPQEGGVMYAAVENGSESSANISLFVPEGSDIVLAVNGVYVLTVHRSQDGGYYEVLTVTE